MIAEIFYDFTLWSLLSALVVALWGLYIFLIVEFGWFMKIVMFLISGLLILISIGVFANAVNNLVLLFKTLVL